MALPAAQIALSPAGAFGPAFAQRALLAVLALALAAAAIGPAIVLRDLPFFAHAVGAGAYPALVLGVALGVSLTLAAPVGALLFAAVLWALTRGRARGDDRDAEIGVLIAGAFAVGSVLVSTALSGRFAVALSPEALLFGSVLTTGTATIGFAFAVAGACGLAAWMLGRSWLATGFDPVAGGRRGVGAQDAVLLGVVALAVAAALPVAGALMGAALLVIPAATARMLTDRFGRLAPLTGTLAAADGAGGLYLALAFDLPPGAAVATLAGVVFAIVALGRRFGVVGLTPRRRLAVAALTVLSLAVVGGCGSTAAEQSEKPVVVATTTQLGDIARIVGGRNVAVTTLLSPGVDPHDYEPQPSDVRALAGARVVLQSGGDIDRWLEPALKAAASGRTPANVSGSVTLLSAAQPPTPLTAASPGDEAFNPHWYLAPVNLITAADRVRDELTKADPTDRETFRANAFAYAQRVDATTAALKRCAATIPAHRRAVVAGHNDFEYLTRFLGVNTVAELTANGESSASARDVDEAVNAGNRAGAGAVLTSRGESVQLAHAVARQVGVPALQLYSDSTATSGLASSALGAIAYDAARIVGALGGNAAACTAVRS